MFFIGVFFVSSGKVLEKSVSPWGSYILKQGNPLQNLKTTHSFTIVFKFIVISKLFISWLQTMSENPPTSIDIESERKFDD